MTTAYPNPAAAFRGAADEARAVAPHSLAALTEIVDRHADACVSPGDMYDARAAWRREVRVIKLAKAGNPRTRGLAALRALARGPR